MKTIDERADLYCREHAYQGGYDLEDVRTAHIYGAEAEHDLLTRWRDPKEELPEYAEVVEVKYKAFGKIMMSVAWRLGCSDSGEDVWYIDGTLKRIDPETIIGWREIHE